jgi:hypothetical protein
VRPDGIIVPSPSLDQHLRLVQRRQLLTCQQLVAEFGIEAIAVALRPWRSRLDVERLHADPAEPGAHALGK